MKIKYYCGCLWTKFFLSETELAKLDPRLIQVLAYQRLQQLLTQKVSCCRAFKVYRLLYQALFKNKLAQIALTYCVTSSSHEVEITMNIFCLSQPVPPSPVASRKISFNGLKETIVLPQQAGKSLLFVRHFHPSDVWASLHWRIEFRFASDWLLIL